MSYIKRTLEPIILQSSKEFPAILLTGPRQSGKTTALKHLFGNTHRYLSLEAPDIRRAAVEDPRGFLALQPPPVIFDEVQYAPELFPYIKEQIDMARSQYGQFILTGSQNLLLLERITESLAGRTAILKLLPLTQREINKQPNRLLPWQYSETENRNVPIAITQQQIWQGFLRGNYPELIAHAERDFNLWFASYVQTYLERDIRFLKQIGDLTIFQNFLRMLAARSGQLLNLSELSRDLGLAVNTIKSWVSILEATYQVIILRPYFNNMNKRLVKTPKIYFTDVGILCYLVGLKNYEHVAYGPMAGAIFETAVVSEIFKTYLHQGIEPQIYFWRTANGDEVDLVVADAEKLIPIEIKAAATLNSQMASGIKKFQNSFGEKSTNGYLIYSGIQKLPVTANVTAVPFGEL